MFLKGSFLFLEADNEETSTEETNKYTMEDSEFDTEQSQEETNNDVNNEEEQETTNEGGTEDEETTEDMDETFSSENDIDNTTNIDNNANSSNTNEHKKFILIQEYKSLLTNIINIDISLDNLKKSNNEKTDITNFIISIIKKNEDLKIKINFYLSNNFINNTYEESLTNFLFFKKEFETIIDIIDKLFDDLNQ